MTPQETAAVAQSYRPAVRGWVSECVSARDVDDVVQTVFVAFARDAHRLDVTRVAGWLRAVTRSKVVDHLRRHREDLTDPPDPVSEAPSPEDTLRSRELSESVRQAMAEVVSVRRRILSAVALDGRTMADVAREEGIPESTAQSRLEQGTRDLRAIMERQRAKERRKSGGFSSWGVTWALIDWLGRARRVWRSRWFRFGLATAGGAVVAGGVAGWTGGVVLASAPEERVEVAFEVAMPALPISAPAERGVNRPEVVVRERARHDAGRRFRAERFVAP